MSPQKKPLAKAHALFLKGRSAARGDESKINVVYRKLQISFFFFGRALAAKFTAEGEGLADQGCTINHDVISEICTEYSESLL